MIKRAKLIWIIAVGLCTGAPSFAQRAIPDNNLAYPVHVSIGNSTGSGFFVSKSDGVYFVTARHVLVDVQTHQPIAPQAELQSFSPDPSDKAQNVLQVDLAQLQQTGALKIHPTADVAAFKIGSLSGDSKASQTLTYSSGVVQLKAASGLVGADEGIFQMFADVKISNDVYIFGYPDSLGLEQMPQLARDKPLLRSGIVAGTNQEKKTIVIDCPVFPGNSGGPVVEKDGFNLKIIGVVIEYVPFDNSRLRLPLRYPTVVNSGYSIVAPMDFVVELIN